MPPRLRRTPTALVAAAILLAAPALAAAQTVVFEHNGSATPTCCAWNPTAVGWVYTPTTSFFASAIETRFALHGGATALGGRSLTAELWTAPNGTLLASTVFTSSSSASTWVGGSFAPVALTGGSSYFVAFRGVDGVGVNATSGAPSGEYGGLWVDWAGTSFDYHGGYDPIVRITGVGEVTATPEPASLALLGTGLVGLAAFARRRARRTTAG